MSDKDMPLKVKKKRPVKPTPKPKSRQKAGGDGDLLPDGWERFERAVDIALHTSPIRGVDPRPKK
jgi:hypothetical protein